MITTVVTSCDSCPFRIDPTCTTAYCRLAWEDGQIANYDTDECPLRGGGHRIVRADEESPMCRDTH